MPRLNAEELQDYINKFEAGDLDEQETLNLFYELKKQKSAGRVKIHDAETAYLISCGFLDTCGNCLI
jgi:hypothetical protein